MILQNQAAKISSRALLQPGCQASYQVAPVAQTRALVSVPGKSGSAPLLEILSPNTSCRIACSSIIVVTLHYTVTHSLQRLIMRTKASPNIRVLLGFWKGPIALACHRAVLHSRQHCRTEEKERRCIGRQVAGACYVRVHNSPHVSLAKQSIASSTMVITHSRTNCWHCCMSESPEVSQFAVGTALQSPPVSSSWSNYETITIPWHKS